MCGLSVEIWALQSLNSNVTMARHNKQWSSPLKGSRGQKPAQWECDLPTLCQFVHLPKMEGFYWFQYSSINHATLCFIWFVSQFLQSSSKFLFEPYVYFSITQENGWFFQRLALNSNGALGHTFPRSSSGVREEYCCPMDPLKIIFPYWFWQSWFGITKLLPVYLIEISIF